MVKNNKKTFHKMPWNNLYSSWKNFSANCGVFVSLANTYYTWKYSLVTIAKKKTFPILRPSYIRFTLTLDKPGIIAKDKLMILKARRRQLFSGSPRIFCRHRGPATKTEGGHQPWMLETPTRKSFCLCISLPAGSPVNTSFQMQSAKRLPFPAHVWYEISSSLFRRVLYGIICCETPRFVPCSTKLYIR